MSATANIEKKATFLATHSHRYVLPAQFGLLVAAAGGEKDLIRAVIRDHWGRGGRLDRHSASELLRRADEL